MKSRALPRRTLATRVGLSRTRTIGSIAEGKPVAKRKVKKKATVKAPKAKRKQTKVATKEKGEPVNSDLGVLVHLMTKILWELQSLRRVVDQQDHEKALPSPVHADFEPEPTDLDLEAIERAEDESDCD